MNSCPLFAIGQIGQSFNGVGKRDAVGFTCKFSIHEHPYKDGSWRIPNSLLPRKIELFAVMIDRFKSHGLVNWNVVTKGDCSHSRLRCCGVSSVKKAFTVSRRPCEN